MKKQLQQELTQLLPKWYNTTDRVNFLHYLIQKRKGYVSARTLRLLFGAKTKLVVNLLLDYKEITQVHNGIILKVGNNYDGISAKFKSKRGKIVTEVENNETTALMLSKFKKNPTKYADLISNLEYILSNTTLFNKPIDTTVTVKGGKVHTTINSMSKRVKRHLKIDNKPTIELNLTACYIQTLLTTEMIKDTTLTNVIKSNRCVYQFMANVLDKTKEQVKEEVLPNIFSNGYNLPKEYLQFDFFKGLKELKSKIGSYSVYLITNRSLNNLINSLAHKLTMSYAVEAIPCNDSIIIKREHRVRVQQIFNNLELNFKIQ